MITVEQINGEIAALSEERPTYVIMEKLAALYTVRDHIIIGTETNAQSVTISENIPHISDSEFAESIDGMTQEKVWPIVDELMETLKAMQPRLYRGVMLKIDQLKE